MLKAIHLLIKMTFEFPALDQLRKTTTLATPSCLNYKATTGLSRVHAHVTLELLANLRSELRNLLRHHVNFLFCTQPPALLTFKRQPLE